MRRREEREIDRVRERDRQRAREINKMGERQHKSSSSISSINIVKKPGTTVLVLNMNMCIIHKLHEERILEF